MAPARWLVALCVVVVATFAASPGARACGMFVAPAPEGAAATDARVPYLARERILVAWDASTETEDFVREARFERSTRAFGFVVPVPTEPTVFKVASEPFTRLEARFGYTDPTSTGGLSGLGLGSGSGAGPSRGSPVTVLSEQRIGSFTAFVLAASDANGLGTWLTKNGFQVSPAARPWLEHFVRLAFYYVVFRYDAPQASPAHAGAGAGASVAASMTSETVRIRFKTPVPYDPYFEPSSASPGLARELSVWFVSQAAHVPVAGVTREGVVTWERPWSAGVAYRVPAADVRAALGELGAIVPADGELAVLPFRDRKVSRDGWGDVLFVPSAPTALDAAAAGARWPLLAVMDPRLEGALDGVSREGLTVPLPAPLPATPAQPATSASETPHAPSASPAPIAPSRPASARARYRGLASAVGLLALLVLVLGRRDRRAQGIAAGLAVIAVIVFFAAPAPVAAPASGPESPSGPESASTAALAYGSVFGGPPVPASAPATADDPRARAQSVLALLAGGGANDLEVEAFPPPAPTATGDVTLDVGGLTPDEARVASTLRPGLRRCYRRGLDEDPSMSGTVVLTAALDGGGDVTSVTVTKNTGASFGVAACMAGFLRRAQFAPPGGPSARVALRIALKSL